MEQGRAFRVEPCADGTAYVLPMRRIVWPIVLAVILFGGWLITTGVAMLHMEIRYGMLPILAGALALLVLVVLRLGRDVVEIGRDEVRGVSRFGPMRLTRRLNRAQVRRLLVCDRNPITSDSPAWRQPSAALYVMPNDDDGQPMRVQMMSGTILVWCYPCRMLTELADELAKVLTPDHLVGIVTPTPVERVINHADAPPLPHRPVPQPRRPYTKVARRESGITLTVPPVGLFQGGGGMMVLSVPWNGFLALATVLVYRSMHNGLNDDMTTDKWVLVWGVIALFWAVGIGVIVYSFIVGRSTAVLEVVGDTLVVSQRSLLGAKQHRWKRSQIAMIRACYPVKRRPEAELQIHTISGQKTSILRQLPDKELAWIAWLLRDALGMTDVVTEPIPSPV